LNSSPAACIGSSAGVALANLYPEARSVGLWLRHGWHVALAYVIGFFVLLAVLGWHPHAQRTRDARPAVSSLPTSQYQVSIAFTPPRD